MEYLDQFRCWLYGGGSSACVLCPLEMMSRDIHCGVEMRAVEARGCMCFSFGSYGCCVKSAVKYNATQGLTGNDASGPT